MRPIVRLVIGAAALSGCCVACSPSHKVRVAHPPPARGAELPIEFVLHLPTTQASIDATPVTLIIDLGGHDTITLQDHIIDSIEAVQPNGKHAMAFDAAGKMSINRGFSIPSLEIAGIELADIEGHAIEFGGPEDLEQQADGYLGNAILSQFDLLIDYPRQRMELYPSGRGRDAMDTTEWLVCRINRDRQSAGMVNGTPATIGWDTGANHTVIDPGFARRAGIDMPPGESGFLTSSITLADIEFPEVQVHTNELRGARVDVLLGTNFFENRRVLFDFTRLQVLVEHGG